MLSRSIRFAAVVAVSALVACASTQRKAELGAVGETQTVETPAGATLTVPEGFAATVDGNVIRLHDPDGETDVWLVELESENTQGAIDAAWARVDPSFSGKPEQDLAPPASGGYDELRIVNYALGDDEVFSQAVARRKGPLNWVSIVRGVIPALDKRSAQIKTFLSSMDAPGVESIDLSDETPDTIVNHTDALRAFIERAMKETKTPGFSIAVVENGEVVYAEGFGVREQGKPDKVTPDTLMMIGSVTKSMTTLMMATLVDDGKLSWTQPVTEVLPNFQIADADLTTALTVEQLVCACAGLPRKDLPLILAYGDKKPGDVFRELGAMAPSTGLNETFQYQNHMVAAGGYLAGHAFAPDLDIGSAYDRAMHEQVFAPLGMKRTTLNLDEAIKDHNWAMPHSRNLQAENQVIALDQERFATYVRPSGGVWSSVNEMARFVAFELARGKLPNGSRLVSEDNLTHRWEPQVALNADASYGLGWVTETTKGLRHINHNGGTMGFATALSFYPDKKLGVVMISNSGSGYLVEKMTNARLLELWFGIDDHAEQKLEFAIKTQHEEIAKFARRSSNPEPELVEALLGTRRNPEIGEVQIAREGDAFVLDTGEYRSALIQYQRPDGKTVFVFAEPPLAGLEIEPLPKDAGGVFEMTRGQEKYVFQ